MYVGTRSAVRSDGPLPPSTVITRPVSQHRPVRLTEYLSDSDNFPAGVFFPIILYLVAILPRFFRPIVVKLGD